MHQRVRQASQNEVVEADEEQVNSVEETPQAVSTPSEQAPSESESEISPLVDTSALMNGFGF